LSVGHGPLSQWWGYGESGGFAIEFDEDGIDDCVIAETKRFAHVGSKTDDVLYEKYEKLFSIEHYKGIAGDMLRRLVEPHNVSETTGQKDIDTFIWQFQLDWTRILR